MNHAVPSRFQSSPSLRILKLGLVFVSIATCGWLVPLIERLTTPSQMANSILPLVVMLGVPFFLSFGIGVLNAKASKSNFLHVVFGTIAFSCGDIYCILYDKGDNHTLWPIEIVILTCLVAGALLAGNSATKHLRT